VTATVESVLNSQRQQGEDHISRLSQKLEMTRREKEGFEESRVEGWDYENQGQDHESRDIPRRHQMATEKVP
jgi:hypothetical protein